MRTFLLTGTLAVLSFACAAPRATAVAPTTKAAEASASAAPAEALPFIENDYPRALAEAKAKQLPVFVDVWAPW